MEIYVNGSSVESRSSDSAGTYVLSVGDDVYFSIYTSGCSGGNPDANSYTLASSPYLVLSDASCSPGSSSLTTGAYTVQSGDGSLTVNAYSACDSGCV
jgi:hypothetical protein